MRKDKISNINVTDLAISIAKRRGINNQIIIDECIDAAVNAVMDYKDSFGVTQKSYIYTCVNRRISDLFKTKKLKIVPLDKTNEPVVIDKENNHEQLITMNQAMNDLAQKFPFGKKVIEKLYFEGKTYDQTLKETGVNYKSQIDLIKNRSLKLLRGFMAQRGVLSL